MADEIDSGDILVQKKVKIDFADTWVTLRKKIEKATDELLHVNIPKFYAGKLNRYKQNEALATHNKRLNKESPLIDLKNMSNCQIYNLIRAQVSPLNGAYIINNNKKIYFPHFVEYNKIEELRKKYS